MDTVRGAAIRPISEIPDENSSFKRDASHREPPITAHSIPDDQECKVIRIVTRHTFAPIICCSTWKAVRYRAANYALLSGRAVSVELGLNHGLGATAQSGRFWLGRHAHDGDGISARIQRGRAINGNNTARGNHPRPSLESFWMNVSVSGVIGPLLAAAAPLIAWFYREPRLVSITVILAATFP